MRKIIKTDQAPAAVGTYSQGISLDGMVFTSGQIPMNPETGKIAEGEFADRVHQVMKNIIGVLEAGGSSLDNVIKFTVFMTDLSQFSILNEVFSQYFETDPPARSAVEVAGLPLGVDVEIEAVALK